MILVLLGIAAAAELRGKVVEFGSGDPITTAVVEVGEHTLHTDARGRFTLGDIPEGEPLSIKVFAADYLDWSGEWSGDNRLSIYLKPAPAPLEVVVESLRPSPNLTRHTVDSEMVRDTPGNYDDAVRLVQGLPGVAVQREYSPNAGDLAIRGATPGDNRYLVDGIEVPYLYHFNQYASVLPAQQLSYLDMFPSNFGVRFGDAVGAIIDAHSTDTAPKTVHGDAQLNFLMLGASVRSPLSPNWWASISGRRSYQDLAGEQTAQYTLWPVFHDYSIRVQHSEANKTTSIFSWGAGDRYTRAAGELDILDPLEAAQTSNFTYKENFSVNGLQHVWSKDALAGRVVSGLVKHHRSGRLDSGSAEDLNIITGSSRGDLSALVAANGRLNFGWELRHGSTNLAAHDEAHDGLLVHDEAPAIARGVTVDAGMTRHRMGAYGEAQIWLGDFVALPGFRVDTDSHTWEPEAQPRLTLRWAAADQTHLKASAGVYSQRPATAELLIDPDLPTTRAKQLGFGVEQTVAERLEFQLEGYYKGLEYPLVIPKTGPVGVAERGRSWGIEFVTRYRLRNVFFLWGWLTVSRSQWEIDQTWVATTSDQPIAGGLVSSWQVTDRWTLGLRYRTGSGLPYTPVIGSIYDAGHDSWEPVTGDENSERFPHYHRLDFRAATNWSFREWALSLTLDLIVIPPSSTQLYPTWNYNWRQTTWVKGPSLLPLFTLRADF
jgi:hypothetical protein